MNSKRSQSGRSFGATVHRHSFSLLAIFAMICSVGFLLAPLIRRSYTVQSEIQIKLHAFDPIGELRRVPAGVVKELSVPAAGQLVQLSVDEPGPDAAVIHLSSTAATRDTAMVHVRFIADQINTALRHRVDELTSSYRSDLTKQSDRLNAREQSLAKEIEKFRLAHRGTLPDDPTSIIAQFEKLATRLDDKQQRQRVVIDQIARLEAYKQNRERDPAGSASPAVFNRIGRPIHAAARIAIRKFFRSMHRFNW